MPTKKEHTQMKKVLAKTRAKRLPKGKYEVVGEVDMDGNVIYHHKKRAPQESKQQLLEQLSTCRTLLDEYRKEREASRKQAQEYNDQLHKASVENRGLQMANDRLVLKNNEQKILLEKAAIAMSAIFAPNED